MKQNLNLARKCKEIRQNAGITVNDWADTIGCKTKKVMDFEKGIINIPTLVLVQYAKLKEQNERGKNEKTNR